MITKREDQKNVKIIKNQECRIMHLEVNQNHQMHWTH